MKKQGYRLLVVGPANRHLENFVLRVIDDVSAIEVISNKVMDMPEGVVQTHVSFSLRQLSNLINTPKLIRDRIKQFRPDVLHVHEINSVAFYAMLANRKANIPSVVTAWGSDILLNPDKSKLLRWMVKYVLKRGSAFTSDSTFMAEKMRSLMPERELDIEICNFGVPAVPIGAIKKMPQVYSNRMHNPLYRIDLVIKAFKRFVEVPGREEWKLIIAGRGSETERLKSLAIELGISDQVEFVGFLTPEENNNFYKESSLFVSIPESDATAMSLLEAMYFKCVPVVCDLPANREWIQEGVNGVIVNDYESDFLGGALSLNLDQVGELNHTKILSEATYEVSRQKFTGLHHKIIRS